MNPNWTRWIVASINKHFADIIKPDLDLYIEGTDRRTGQEQNYAELRHDGPRCTELSKGYWHIDVVVDILVVSKTNDQDIYTLERNLGLVQSAFTEDIPVFKYGDDPSDQLGCLTLCPRPDEPIRTNNFGQVENDTRLRQASVDACYRMNLSE
jgi:hypothetical protein